MRTLKKTDIESMERELRVLKNPEQIKIIGGTGYLEIKGGALVQLDGGVMYVPFGSGSNGSSSGNAVFFEGVTISTSSVTGSTSYQMNGTIHIDSNWAANGFNLCDFAHEYGHYLQQQEWGNAKYYGMAASPDAQWYETNASERGYAYLFNYGWSCN
jgi:hypothetical protein